MIIEVKDNVIITEWWTSKEEEDGKKQITKETVYGKNKGRSNETTDNEQAILEYERKIRKKKEEGYVENREDAILGEEIVVSSALSQSFAPCKPISKLKKDDDPYDASTSGLIPIDQHIRSGTQLPVSGWRGHAIAHARLCTMWMYL